jgi:hypothetical protein
MIIAHSENKRFAVRIPWGCFMAECFAISRDSTGDDASASVPRSSSVGGLYQVPLLEELAADPSKARVLDAHTARISTTTALAALNALNSRELALAAERTIGATSERRDRLLNIDEISQKLGVKSDCLYRRHRRLPFTVPQGSIAALFRTRDRRVHPNSPQSLIGLIECSTALMSLDQRGLPKVLR